MSLKLKKEDFDKLEKAINLLQDINKNIITTHAMDVIIMEASEVILALKENKRSKPFVLDKRHVNYLDSVREELVKAEKTIDDIKNSEEWKRVINYFKSYYTRGKLSVKPTKDNGYTYKLNDGYYNHNKPLNQTYVDYLDKTREELVKAEEVVGRIKNSAEWKKCQSYFITCEHRNLLECRPSKKNGYTVKAKEF